MGFKQRFQFFYNLDYHYAFVQVILMVTSILIAFWVDTWWQGKQDIKKEDAYLSALESELEENRAKYNAHLQVLNDDIKTTNAFLSLLQENQTGDIPPDSLQKYLWPLITVETLSPTRAALDDLVNSGGMQYIRSDILRRQIATYKQSFEFDFDKQQMTAELWSKTLSVFNLNNINLSQLVPARPEKSLDSRRSVQVPRMNFPSNFSALDRKKYANRLTQRILLINRLRQTHDDVLNNIRILLFQLGMKDNAENSSNTIRG